MSGQTARQTETAWPGTGVLLWCVGLLVAGYMVALWRGPAAAGEVQVRMVPPPAAEVPAEP
jgi:hypothetical protein